MLIQKNTKDSLGFSLIETVIGIFILALISLSLYALINFTLKVIWESKAKITATQLANSRIELAMNLDYENVGTLGGIPAGPIEQSETILRNGIEYTVATDVQYVDDEFDGTEDGDPDDLLPTDYKKIRVEVSWNYRLQSEPVILVTNIVPPGLESAVGGGTLKILVYDAEGVPVASADVTIDNTDVDPIIGIDTQTDANGYVILPGSPESTEGYQISVTKSGYSSDQTYATTPELPAPEKPHASIFEGQTTNISFAIDKPADLNVTVQNEFGIPLSGVVFDVQGADIIGYDGETPIYRYDNSHTTNGLGQINLTDVRWDSYTFTPTNGSPYDISETDPIQPIDLLPDTNQNLLITLDPNQPHSALIIVKDINDSPLVDATVHFYTASLDETATTSDAGQTYFSPWEEATSTLEVSLDGYEDYIDEFELSGYHIEQIIMTVP